MCVCSVLPDSVTLWTVARQAPLSMGFPGKNTGVGCHLLLQRVFLAQGLNPCFLLLLHWQAGSLPLVPPGKPVINTALEYSEFDHMLNFTGCSALSFFNEL